MRDKIARLLYNRKRSHTAGYGRVKVTSFLRCKECFQVLLPLRLIVPVLESRSKSFFFFFLGNKREELSRYFFFIFLSLFSFSPFFFETRVASRLREYSQRENINRYTRCGVIFFFFNRVQVFVKSAT